MKYIVVVTNGFVFMGEVTKHDGYMQIDNADCIRKWGTSHGLGEIAAHGPTKDTILDPTGVVEVLNHAVIALIRCTYD
jgi:hypothetical protein